MLCFLWLVLLLCFLMQVSAARMEGDAKTFGTVVTCPYIGASTSVAVIDQALRGQTSTRPVGKVVAAPRSGSAGRLVAAGWCARLSRADGDADTQGEMSSPMPSARPPRHRAAAPAHDGGGAASALRHSQSIDDDGGGSAGLHDAPQRVVIESKRQRAVARAPTLEQLMEEALIPCIQRTCGLPSSSPFGRDAARVTATVIGDPASRSRAIVLRHGQRRDEAAIMWVSPRGGLLCSCYGGTQNGSFLSASSRSSECVHAKILDKCLVAAGVSVNLLRRRLSLTADAANFAVSRMFGSTLVVYVLYRKVYSMVTFIGKYGTCVAPGCRSFSRRCGHVVVARRYRDNLPVNNREATPDGEHEHKSKPPTTTPCGRQLFLTDEEEDTGLEKLPSDTVRSGQDAPDIELSARLKRNMLPCSGELLVGEAWNRAADWRSMYMRRSRMCDDQRAHDLRTIMACYAAAVKRGLAADTREPLVESHCGSCGHARTVKNKVTFEQGVVTTHHPTAPRLRVRYCLLFPLMCADRLFDDPLSLLYCVFHRFSSATTER